ncbi:galactose-specific lectin nattectin-like [Poecilia reticulata]|uniref:galactose-specific lectin nattectin-like n=1 Tax=Poecilia reticulata TaxID=8081 RepID=UPI0004A28255|nr:PREDICTED: galactose-specific lectin nattectin-like [Poecilia reticulata]
MNSVLLCTLLLCGFGLGVAPLGWGLPDPAPRSAAVYKMCPAGWTRYRGDCYLYDDTELTWIQAELHCISSHGNLATIQNQHQYTFLRSLIFKSAGTHKRTWVGGYDGVEEGTWLWSRGTKFDFTQWGPEEPNDFEGNEDCMEINREGEDYVNDIRCDRENSFICVRRP